MADLFFDDVRSNDELIRIATQLLESVARGDDNDLIAPGRIRFCREDGAIRRATADDLWDMYLVDEVPCYDIDHSEHCECVWEAAQTDPRQGVVVEFDHTPGPLQYVPCPQRGTHIRLAECWMCWCDVDRGVITAAEALAPKGVRA